MKEDEFWLLQDIVSILIEKNIDSKKDSSSDPVRMGKHLAYYDVLSLIYQQALAFGVDPAMIGMEDYYPDKDAL